MLVVGSALAVGVLGEDRNMAIVKRDCCLARAGAGGQPFEHGLLMVKNTRQGCSLSCKGGYLLSLPSVSIAVD